MSETYVVGDIHGHSKLATELIYKIESELSPGDHVVFLGDYIDRGEDSKGVIAAILEFCKRCPGQITCLKGNHEQWFLEAYRDYSKTSWLLTMGGLATVASYSKEAAGELEKAIRFFGKELIWPSDQNNPPKLPYHLFFPAMPEEHLSFFLNLPLFYENDEVICVHAGLNVVKPLSEQMEDEVLWGNPIKMLKIWDGPKTLVLGHEPTHKIQPEKLGQPIVGDRVVLLDTGPSVSGVLSAIRFPDRQIFQVAI